MAGTELFSNRFTLGCCLESSIYKFLSILGEGLVSKLDLVSFTFRTDISPATKLLSSCEAGTSRTIEQFASTTLLCEGKLDLFITLLSEFY